MGQFQTLPWLPHGSRTVGQPNCKKILFQQVQSIIPPAPLRHEVIFSLKPNQTRQHLHRGIQLRHCFLKWIKCPAVILMTNQSASHSFCPALGSGLERKVTVSERKTAKANSW